MAKKRVYEIAKEMGLGTRELVRILEILGATVKSHMSTVEPETLQKVNEYLEQRKIPAKAAPQAPQQAGATRPRGKTAAPEKPTRVVVPPRREAPQRPAVQHKGPAQPGSPRQGQGAGTGHRQGGPAPAEGPRNRMPQGGGKGPASPAGAFRNQAAPANRTTPVKADSGLTGKKPGKGQTGAKAGQAQRPGRDQASTHLAHDRRRDNAWSGGHFYSHDHDNEEEDRIRYTKARRRKTRGSAKEAAPVPTAPAKKIALEGKITVQELASRMGRRATDLIKKLVSLGVMVGLNEEIDQETAILLANEFGVEVRLKIEKPATEVQEVEDNPAALEERPPVVTVMGHVDHGKTSLLDAIRHTNVTAQEAGGITQHIGAYQVDVEGRKITFVDTPGHAAFTAMRARGAQVTDIAVLVVAADDGVMPQTVEAIHHAQAAGVPIVVAINKIDRPDANPERVKQQLAERELVPEEWGGDTICVPVSAVKKQGLTELLEMLLLVADLQGLKADPTKPAKGVVLEAELDRGRGPMATVLVHNGTLRVGDNFVVGATYGRVRGMLDDQGKAVKEATPSMPVRILGLADVPEAGDILQAADEKTAREVALARQAERRRGFAPERTSNVEDILKQMEGKGKREQNIIVKGDVQGTVQAVCQALERLGTEEVAVKVIHGGVGAITVSDVMLAAASQAMIVGFNVRPEAGARRAAEEQRVEIRLYRIIYDLLEEMKATLSGMLEPEIRELELGRVEVRAIFHVPKVGVVAGCYVLEGKVTKNASVRLVRDGTVVYEGRIGSLRRFKDDVREVAQGYECGMSMENFNDIKEGDIIEAYVQEKVKREL